jgi:hypothetical protein
MNPKDQLAEIEKMIKAFEEGNVDTYALKQKKQGFLLGTISQLKENRNFIVKELLTIPYDNLKIGTECKDELCPNRYLMQNRVNLKYNRITADLKFYEDKLKEMVE